MVAAGRVPRGDRQRVPAARRRWAGARRCRGRALAQGGPDRTAGAQGRRPVLGADRLGGEGAADGQAGRGVPDDRGAAACERGQLAYAATVLGVRDRADEARSALGRAAALLSP
ncbi:hypothetical protein ACWFRK_26035, partial [Streptomyces sp. NPDC055157]